MSEIKVDTIGPRVDNGTLTIGASGDTVNIAGTAGTGFPTPTTGIAASAITTGTMATARLGSGTASSSTFLRGDQTYAAAGGDNTPAFSAQMGFNQEQSVSDGVVTKAEVDTEYFDTNSAFDTSNYRFTVPSGEGGNYLFSWGLYCYAANTSSNIQYCNATVRKNGSDYIGSGYDFRDNEIRAVHFGQSCAFNVSAGDYFELWGQIKVNSGTPSFYGGARQTFLGAMKILT